MENMSNSANLLRKKATIHSEIRYLYTYAMD